MKLYKPDCQLRLTRTDMQELLHELETLGFGLEDRKRKDDGALWAKCPALDEIVFQLKEELK